MAKGNWNPPSDTMRCDVSPIACQRVNVNVRDEASHRMSPPGAGAGGDYYEFRVSTLRVVYICEAIKPTRLDCALIALIRHNYRRYALAMLTPRTCYNCIMQFRFP